MMGDQAHVAWRAVLLFVPAVHAGCHDGSGASRIIRTGTTT